MRHDAPSTIMFSVDLHMWSSFEWLLLYEFHDLRAERNHNRDQTSRTDCNMPDTTVQTTALNLPMLQYYIVVIGLIHAEKPDNVFKL
jgi:hypothetical protein